MDNDAIRFLAKRALKFGPGGTNYLTGLWVVYGKVDTDSNFSKFKARWVCRGFQDRRGWEQEADSPTATRYGLRLVRQQAASLCAIFLRLNFKAAFLEREHYNSSRRAVIIQLPGDFGLPPYLVGYCMRPVYGLNDAP